MSADLIDRNQIYKFCELTHTRAAAAIAGMGDPRQPVLHLCFAAANDTRFFTSAYYVGDFLRMADDAIVHNASGQNVYVEGRLCRAGSPHERGRLEATLAVFGLVADSDCDTGKQFSAPVPASVTVETSPQNDHSWFYLRRAIGWGDGQEFRKLVGRSAGGDACSFVVSQPYRISGSVNWPSKTKVARGRVPVPTKIKSVTGITYSIDELRAAFQPSIASAAQELPMPAAALHSRSYGRSMVKAILAAEPRLDRSAAFMSAANHAVRAGMTADEFEILARRYRGCSQKYIEGGDRLRQEIDRCFLKIGRPSRP